MARKVISKQESFLNDIASSKHTYIKEFMALANLENPAIQLSPHEIDIVHFLIKMLKPKRILEIGTLNGMSAYSMHIASGAMVDTIEFNKEAASRARNNLTMLNASVNVIEGDAEELLPTLKAESYDLVFIDANKAAYPFYLKEVKRLLRLGGLVIADNIFLFGNVYDNPWQDSNDKSIVAMKEFISELSQSKDFESTIIPTTEGLMLGIKAAII